MSGTLEQRVAALEQALAGVQGSEALNPNYLTVSPAGVVGAVFTGGVQMIEQVVSGTYSSGKALGWLDSAGGGQIREFISGAFNGTSHGLQAISQADANDQAFVSCFSQAAGPSGSASVAANAFDSSGSTSAVTVIDSAGNSSFLQLVTSAKGKLQIGKATATPAAGWSTPYTITFPVFYTATPVVLYAVEVAAGAGAQLLGQELRSVTNTGFLVDINMGVSVATALHWIAIG